MTFKNILLISMLATSLSSHGQIQETRPVTYTIDPSVAAAADKSTRTENELRLGQMDIILFQNDKEIHNTLKTNKKIPFFVRTNISGDVISISGFAGMFAGFGFILFLRGDSCDIFFNITTDDPSIYKLNITDSVYKPGLLVPCTVSKIVLSRKPDPKKLSKTQPMEGYIELESREFYENSNGDDKKSKAVIKTYFKTDEIE